MIQDYFFCLIQTQEKYCKEFLTSSFVKPVFACILIVHKVFLFSFLGNHSINKIIAVCIVVKIQTIKKIDHITFFASSLFIKKNSYLMKSGKIRRSFF
jgi:hypothetical protein